MSKTRVEGEEALLKSPYVLFFYYAHWGFKMGPCWVCKFWDGHQVHAICRDAVIKKGLAYIVTLALSPPRRP
jgi:hypothetical protein